MTTFMTRPKKNSELFTPPEYLVARKGMIVSESTFTNYDRADREASLRRGYVVPKSWWEKNVGPVELETHVEEGGAQLTEEIRKGVIEAYERNDSTQTQIAERFGTTQSAVASVLRRYREAREAKT